MTAALHQNTFWNQLALNGRVVTAIVLRETKTKFGRYKFGYAWAFVEPIVYVSLFVLIRAFVSANSAVGTQMVIYVVTALLAFRMFMAISSATMKAVASNIALLAFPPVKPVDCMVARVILEALTMAVIWLIFYTALSSVSELRVVVDYNNLVAAFGAIVLLAAGVGTLNAIISALFSWYERVWSMLSLPLFIMSGVFFNPEQLPQAAKAIVVWNPIAHCVEWVRFSTQFTYHPMLDRVYVVSFGLLALVAGLLLERMNRYRLLSQ
jgi:capsular polysaccharide transport system permease protein